MFIVCGKADNKHLLNYGAQGEAGDSFSGWFVLIILISALSLQTSWCLEAEGKSPVLRTAVVQN